MIGSFRGLGQMVAEKHYLEENPYDPLTALRMSLRNMIYFVYKVKNVEAALAEHNNGKIGIIKSRVGVDAFATIGQEFTLRVVNAAWWGHYLIEKNDYYTGSENYHHQWDIQHPNAPYYHYAPPWDFHKLNKKGELVIQEPDLPFNWKPPASSKAFRRLNTIPGVHFKQKIRNLILRPIHRNVWTDDIVFMYPVHKDPGKDKSRCQKVLNGSVIILKGIKIPDWFYTASIAPEVLPLKLQALTKNHELIYPHGIKGKTPASSGKRHNLFLEDGDPLKDSIGRDRNGRWYCYTRKSFKRE